jgi:hypothetical protein
MPPVRHLVLDSEAVSALLATDARHRKRRLVIEAVMAANGRRVAPTAVRAEAGWHRQDPAAAPANRLVPEDDVLDRSGTDRTVGLRRAVRSASLVDAAVAVTAERIGTEGVVEILTSDPSDLRDLAAYLRAVVDVQRI